MKMRLKLLSQHGALSPGVYTFSGKLADYLMRTGKGIPVIKEEKKVLVTKEEKFIPETKVEDVPETKDYSGVPISKLDVSQITTEDLQVIADTDTRVTARRLAEEELNKR